MKATTPCECETAGWCPRHQCWKSDLLHHLCRTHAGLFRRWEAGSGPGQAALGGGAAREFLRCRHRGPAIRLALCAACRGTVHLKVFACRIHGECDISGRLPAVPSCATCPDCEVTPDTNRSDDGPWRAPGGRSEQSPPT